MLGHGAFSVVFKVKHEYSQNYYAAKAVELQPCGFELQYNVLKAEMDALKALYHPNIIKIFDVIQKKNYCFMIIELITGGSVTRMIQGSPKGLPLNQLISIMRQILSAISFCHSKKISHRDIKPGNILVDKNGRAVLSDFGLSCRLAKMDKVNDFCGSLPYKPPEIIRKIAYNPMYADIWSLGVTFYSMAVGHLPWNNHGAYPIEELIMKARVKIPSRVPERVASIIRSMLQIDPLQRPQAEELLRNPIFLENPNILIPCIPAKISSLPTRHSLLSLTNDMLPGRTSRVSLKNHRSKTSTFTFLSKPPTDIEQPK